MTRPFLSSLVLASILAVGIAPMNRWLARRLGHPGLTTFLTTFGSVLALAAVIAFVGIAFTGELRSTYDSLNRKSLEQGGWPQLVESTTERIADALASRVHLDKEEIRTRFTEGLKSSARYLLDHIGAAVGGVTATIFTLIFTTVFLYILLRRGDELFARVIQFSPLDSAVTARLLGTILNTVSASVNGVLAVAAAQGLALSFGFWMADVRSPLLWGMVGGVASLIPLLGCPLVWVPVVVAFAFMGAWWKVVFLSVWGALIVGSIDNIVRPLVVSASTKLHPLLMAIAALGGTYAFGVLGILLGPLVVSVAGALVVEIQTELEAARANEISTA
ncbi:MAG: hypothetical protein JWN34_487 [Bryobacterales bacterium]|nr:hypothetical protein [Bryobacterales bacterium]